MPTPTVAVPIPAPHTYSDPDNLRPQTRITWSGATGPTVDVLHEWDTDNGFGSPITDSNTAIAVGVGEDVGIPPSDLGPAGTPWFYRVTVTDNADAQSTTSPSEQLDWIDAKLQRRYLYEEVNDGVAFAVDEPAGGWGSAGTPHVDGDNDLLRRYLYEEQNGGVGFDPSDTPAGGWDPELTGNPLIGPGDGYQRDFRAYLYEEFGDVDTSTPTPHIWYVFPSFGREGWEFRIIGYGFGDTQATYSGSATLNAVALSILTWELIAESNPNLTIDPIADIAEPVHQQIRTSVPIGGTSGLVIVCTDGP